MILEFPSALLLIFEMAENKGLGDLAPKTEGEKDSSLSLLVT
jgi:hypothetical protein